MVRAFISIGSNINPSANVESALRTLAKKVHITAVSTVYASKAEGRPGQPDFYNCVAEIETDLNPTDLKYNVLRPIEAELGRRRTPDKYAPRTIDLDLILYGNLVLNTQELVLPDPEIPHRPFIALPLAALDSGLIIPGINMPISQIAAVSQEEQIRPLTSYTEYLRHTIR